MAMGHSGNLSLLYNGECYIEHVKIDRDGYDSRGVYWGLGRKLYRIDADEYDEGYCYVRARDLGSAKRLFPNAKFIRYGKKVEI